MNHEKLSDLASKRQGELHGLVLGVVKPCCKRYSVSFFMSACLTGLMSYKCCLIGLVSFTLMSCTRTVVWDGTSLKRQENRATKSRTLHGCSGTRWLNWDGNGFNISKLVYHWVWWGAGRISNPLSPQVSEVSVTISNELLRTGFCDKLGCTRFSESLGEW